MILRKSCLWACSFLLISLLVSCLQLAAQTPVAKRQFIIKSARQYDGAAIESIIITDDKKGVVLKTVNGKNFFLDRQETQQQLGITITENDFFLPKDATVIYYDLNGVPSENYFNYTYAHTNQGLPYLIKTSRIEIRSDSVQPLYIINGKEASKEEMFQLNPATIEKIDVLKGDAAILTYGERGSVGVVVITLKPLYIINGKESSKEEMVKLDSSTIDNITVLNSDSASVMYGERGRNGVVVIMLKQPTINTAKALIETAPMFPGGTQAWRKYIEKSIRYPRDAMMAKKSGKVKVSVTVAKDGSISAVPVTSLGYGLEEEALRIMKGSPKWSPAIRNGEPVTYKFTQSVSFNTF